MRNFIVLLALTFLPVHWVKGADCRLLLMIEGPMDASHAFLRIDHCGESKGKVSYQVENENPSAVKKQKAVSSWKASLLKMQKEVDLLAATPEEESTRCFQPVHVHWKSDGEPRDFTKCPVGKAGERIQSLATAARMVF